VTFARQRVSLTVKEAVYQVIDMLRTPKNRADHIQFVREKRKIDCVAFVVKDPLANAFANVKWATVRIAEDIDIAGIRRST